MNAAKVRAVYFSATGTTKKTTEMIAQTLAKRLLVPFLSSDFTLPKSREQALCFREDDLVVLGTPVYAGRVPNVLLNYLGTIEGNQALVVPVVSYGNRAYDDALIELTEILKNRGMHPLTAAAFIGEHSFSRILAKGRPDEKDLALAKHFAEQTATKLLTVSGGPPPPAEPAGVPFPHGGYYKPKDGEGNPVDLRKVKPRTGPGCTDCKACAELCPMGSISYEDVREFTGICIKCGACIKGCPEGVKYFDDISYLNHKTELEMELTKRAEPEIFL